jgi:hypothetical protein
MSGPLSVSTENWGLILRNGAGADNVQPQNGIGSAYVNDVYIRSAGKWASQLGGDVANLSGIGHTTLSSGLIFAWGYYPYQIPNNNSYTWVSYDQPFPHAVFNCMITPGFTGLSNDNGPLTVSGCTTSGMTAFNTSDAVPVNGFYWFAIGY